MPLGKATLGTFIFLLGLFYMNKSIAFDKTNVDTVFECLNNGKIALYDKALDRAEDQLSCALVNAREELSKFDLFRNVKPETLIEILHYYGLAKANLCKWSEAEAAFTEALSESKKNNPKNPAANVPLLIQLAQFYFERGSYEKSLPYYEETFVSGETIFLKRDPISYALLLEDYSVALENSGKPEAAATAKAKALALRDKYPQGKALTVKNYDSYVPFPKECK